MWWVTSHGSQRFGRYMLTSTDMHHRTFRAALAGAATLLYALTLACSGTGRLAGLSDFESTLLVGEWELVSGCGGIAGQCVEASQLSEPSRYVFEANGFVTAFRGSTQLFRSPYTVTPGSTDGTGDERSILTIGGGPLVDPRPLRVRFETSDVLLLDEGCCDRFTFRFRRLR